MSEASKKVASGPPALNGLLAQYLHHKRAEFVLWQNWSSLAESEFEPYQPAEVSVLDARSVLEEALAAAQWLVIDPTQRGQFHARQMRHVPDWPGMVRQLEPVPLVPFALGYYPQLVRDVQSLLEGGWRNWKPAQGQARTSGLWEWGELMLAQMRPAEALFAMSLLRLLGQTREARQLFRAIKGQAPSSWSVLVSNEDAALAWQEGDYQTASRILDSIASSAPPILFNRGLGALLLGRTRQARDLLAQAAAQLPDSSAWHHLAQLYCLLCE